MFGIDAEVASKVIIALATGSVIGLLTFVANRFNKRDAAEKPPSPAAMGIVLDGDSAQQMVRELREMHADMVRWRAEDRDQQKDDKIERLESMVVKLSQGQGKTHGNQADIVSRVEAADIKIDELMRVLSNPGLTEALKGLKVH